MNAVQFYNPSSITPPLSASCAAILQKHHLFKGVPRQKERNRVHEPFSQLQNTSEEITGKQHKNNTISDCSISADEDDEFPSIDEVLCAQSTLLGYLDGSSKEQPVILDDNDNDDSEDGDEGNDDNENSSSTSGAGISSQEFGPLPSPTTPYPESKLSSSHNPSLQPSTALYDQLPESQVIQQDGGYINREMSEQPICPAFILSDDEDDDMEEEQQPEAGENREQEAHNNDTSNNGDADNNHLQVNDESEGLQTTKQRRLSPSCDFVIRRGHKRQHQETWQRKEQECQESNNTDRKDDQDSDDSEGPRPAKRRGLSLSSSNSTQVQRLQRPHDDDSVSKHTSKHDLQRSRKGDTTLMQNLLEQSSSISNNGCRQSSVAPISTSDQEPASTTRAEYQEWPIFGVFKQVIAGDEVRYGVEFSLEPHTCPQHTVVHQSPDSGDPQPSDSWEIQRITGIRKVNGVKEFCVTWAQTWMPESELGGAKELVEEFKGRLSVRHEEEKGPGKRDVTGEKLKRRRGRPRKQVLYQTTTKIN